jgi:hypothetical protein
LALVLVLVSSVLVVQEVWVEKGERSVGISRLFYFVSFQALRAGVRVIERK